MTSLHKICALGFPNENSGLRLCVVVTHAAWQTTCKQDLKKVLVWWGRRLRVPGLCTWMNGLNHRWSSSLSQQNLMASKDASPLQGWASLFACSLNFDRKTYIEAAPSTRLKQNRTEFVYWKNFQQVTYKTTTTHIKKIKARRHKWIFAVNKSVPAWQKFPHSH